jgi:hypothetical protein
MLIIIKKEKIEFEIVGKKKKYPENKTNSLF